MDEEKLIEFIKEESRLRRGDRRHTGAFTDGFIAACNIILDHIEVKNKNG